MHKILISALFTLQILTCYAFAEQIDIGSKIDDIINQFPLSMQGSGRPLALFKEGTNYKLYKLKNNNKLTALGIQDDDKIVLFGFLVSAKESYYLYDTSGKGILNYKTPIGFIPPWVISPKSIDANADSNFIIQMKNLYLAFKSKEGLSNSKYSKEYFSILKKYFTNEYPDRNYMYTIYLYSGLEQNGHPEVANHIIDALIDKLTKNKVKIPLVINQYKSESLMELNKNDEALTYINKILDEDNTFIPALINKFRLDKNLSKEEKNRIVNIFNQNLDHWAIKVINGNK